jgi:MSHA biogenesis protein MshM
MYLAHFGLDEPPFRITPHTDFFFDGADRGTTLDALVYAVLHDEGIVKVSGEVGSGKTMLCRVLLERLPANVETVYLANPSLTRDELLRSIAEELGITLATDGTRVAMRELFDYLIKLYAEGRRVVILVDEAHAMPEETLEQVRLLSNLESSRHKLLQMVLFGQPELDAALAKTSMRQLKDRITHSFRMRPLSKAEIANYLSFRMRAAGYRGPDVFSRRAVARIAAASNGLSRRINILADKALLAAFSEGRHAVTEREVRAAVRDSEFAALLPPRRWQPATIGLGLLAAGLALGLALHRLVPFGDEPAATAKPPAATAPAAPVATASRTPQAPPAPAVADPTPAATAVTDPALAGPVAEATPQPAQAPPQAAAAEPTPVARLDPDQQKRIAAYPTGANRLLRERIAATLERLASARDDDFAIELFTTDNWDPVRQERFLSRARDLVPLDQIYVIPIGSPKRYRIRVVYGTYSSQEAATEAQGRMPPKYQQAFQMELRSFATLRQDI